MNQRLESAGCNFPKSICLRFPFGMREHEIPGASQGEKEDTGNTHVYIFSHL